jgi:hypothetical protein
MLYPLFAFCVSALSSSIYAPYLFTYSNSYVCTVLYSPNLPINRTSFFLRNAVSIQLKTGVVRIFCAYLLFFDYYNGLE